MSYYSKQVLGDIPVVRTTQYAPMGSLEDILAAIMGEEKCDVNPQPWTVSYNEFVMARDEVSRHYISLDSAFKKAKGEISDGLYEAWIAQANHWKDFVAQTEELSRKLLTPIGFGWGAEMEEVDRARCRADILAKRLNQALGREAALTSIAPKEQPADTVDVLNILKWGLVAFVAVYTLPIIASWVPRGPRN